MSDGEDDVEVGDGQQVPLPGFEPAGFAQRPTLGAMSVAAGVIGDAQYAALITFINVTTQGSRATAGKRGDGFLLFVGERMALPIGLAIKAEDVRHFASSLAARYDEGWRVHVELTDPLLYLR